MIWLFIICLVFAASFLAPFRISSAESKREREELREAKPQFGVCRTIYPPVYEWDDEEAKR